MPDYDLRGLSTSSFEKLIQSLAVKVLGPGAMVFGDGPDGCREATYEGKMSFPSTTEPWDGYCIVQAKFRRRPTKTGEDGDWALNELEKELKKFVDPRRNLRKPDYYIFATNVVLSPVNEAGGKDKVDALLKKYAKKLPLRGHAIWDFDQISSFLDDNDTIRRAYAAWVTSGDVLAQVLDWFEASSPDFGEVIANFLAKEFAADQFARLSQAGQTEEGNIPLASVFVDLPVSEHRLSEPPEEEAEDKSTGIVDEVIEIAKNCFSSGTNVDPVVSSGLAPSSKDESALGRIVLVGGPGQGKTTVSQLICQLFRAALLCSRDPNTLSAPVRDALNLFIASCEEHGISLPKARRFPLRVVLSEFAAELSRAEPGSKPSLLSYFVARIAKRTDRKISPDDFRKWLRAYPWVLIFDGLDEVPVTGNRDQVLEKIEEFWTDAAQCSADVLTIATTRPQGYNDEFSPKYYRHLWLAPLSVRRALVYADLLARSKFGENEERRESLLYSLQEALSHQTTARLMRSPLQVTIMFILVEHGGIPPQDRWRLFRDYYQTIYRRERQRAIPAATLLREREKNIDVIHTRVALLLQVEAETSGGSEAILPRDRFERIVEDHLVEEGIEGDQLNQLTQQIIETVEHRLVFLVGVQEDYIGFEIASLREFMAAQALFEGENTHEEVQARLEVIAPSATWRNVLVFAAGRCFAEHTRRDHICTLCEKLNNGDVGGGLAKETRAGSLLAIDLLEDGMARQSPHYARLLIDRALALLDLPPSQVHQRLAAQWDESTEAVFVKHIQDRVDRTEFSAQLGAWATLLPVVGHDVPAAVEIADAKWPIESDQEHQIFGLPSGDAAQHWLMPRFKRWVPRADPMTVRDLVHTDCRLTLEGPPESAGWLALFSEIGKISNAYFSLPENSGDKTIGRWLKSLDESRAELAFLLRGEQSYEHSGWLALMEAARFALSPCKEALGHSIERLLAIGDLDTTKRVRDLFPWPLNECVVVAETEADLSTIARQAREGAFGDVGDWVAAEERWTKRGISEEDIRQSTDMRPPFDEEIGHRGFPSNLGGHSISIISPAMEHECHELAVLCASLPAGPMRNSLAGDVLFAFTVQEMDFSKVLPGISLADLRCIFSEGRTFHLGEKFVHACFETYEANHELWEFLDVVGRQQKQEMLWPTHLDDAELFVAHLSQHPNHLGVLRLLAMHVLAGKRRVDLRKLQPVDCESTDPRFQNAAIVIRIVQGHLGATEVSKLADATVRLNSGGTNTISSVNEVISRNQLFDSGTERYLLELLSRAKDQPYGDVGRIIDLLKDCLRRRQSGIAQPERWKELALPECLAPLLPVIK